MHCHHEAKLCYLSHPRTASHSVRRALRRQAGFVPAGGGGHARWQDAQERSTLPEIDPETWTFATGVRNHWDAMVSWWHLTDFGEMEFGVPWAERLIENRREIPPHSLWTYHAAADTHLRFERIEEELNALLREHGLPEVDLPRLQVSDGRRGRHYSEFYDREMRAWVAGYFRHEIERFGYEFDHQS